MLMLKTGRLPVSKATPDYCFTDAEDRKMENDEYKKTERLRKIGKLNNIRQPIKT
jgi:hypothetical protein